MSMMVGTDTGDEDEIVSAINTTPLVDVMLVLLIIFLITIPVVNFSVPVALPKLRNQVRESTPQDIVISVDSHGALFWFDSRVANDAASCSELVAHRGHPLGGGSVMKPTCRMPARWQA